MSDSLLTAKCQSKLSLDVGCWNLDFGWRDAGILGCWSGLEWWAKCLAMSVGLNEGENFEWSPLESGLHKTFAAVRLHLPGDVQSAGDICFDVRTWLTCGCFCCLSTGNVWEQFAGLIKLVNQTHITKAKGRQMTGAHSGLKQFYPTIMVKFNQLY